MLVAMPELPEVETTARGIEPHMRDRRIERVVLHQPRLRWPVDPDLPRWIHGQKVLGVRRRAKYILIDVTHGWLLLHLGMSGSLRVLPDSTALEPHDHFDLQLDSGWTVRFNDPRRFGSLHHGDDDPMLHPLLARLAPEPLDPAFDADYLFRVTRRRRVAIKLVIMNGQLVVGVGNIYASEALFRAGIRPGRAASSLSREECAALVEAIREVLTMAIQHGGTTLRDYVGAEGKPGYFKQKLFVYDRAGQACLKCGTPVSHRNHGQRSTFYCASCQK